MTKTQELQKEIKKTTEDAMSSVKTTVESVQRELSDTAGDVKEAVQKVFMAGIGALTAAEEEGSKLFKKLVVKGEKVGLPSLGTKRVEQLRKQLDDAADKATDTVKDRMSDAKTSVTETADKFEDRVQDAVGNVMKRIGVPTREEIADLSASVERLTVQIEALRATRDAAPGTTAPVLESVGGGWYEIKIGDTVVDKVRGKDEAEEAVAALSN